MGNAIAIASPGENDEGGSAKPPHVTDQQDSANLPHEAPAVHECLPIPADVVNEQHVLAAVLKEPTCLAEVRSLLGDGDICFAGRATGAVWRQLIHLNQTCEKVTVTQLRQRLLEIDDEQAVWALDDSVKIMKKMHGSGVVKAARRRAESMLKSAAERETDNETQAASSGPNNHRSGLEPGSQPIWVNMANVQPKPVEWLWPGKIALGKLVIVAGDPGLGKSMLTLDIAARVTRGAPWPDGNGVAPLGGAVLVSAEDDIADTIRPRLDLALADPSRINALQGVQFYDPDTKRTVERSFCLQDLKPLESLIGQTNDCRIVLIDPVSAFSGSVDSHKNAEVRAMLSLLAQLASKHNVAVLLVTHNNKGMGSALNKVMGSIAFTAASRAAWGVYKDPEDPSKRLFLPIKNNIGPDSTGLAYTIQVEGDVGRVEWFKEPVTLSAEELFAIARDVDGNMGKREEALAWLEELLAEGPVASKEIERKGKQAGFSMRTLERAKEQSKGRVVHKREGFGPQSTCYWRLAFDQSTSVTSSSLSAYGQNGAASGFASGVQHRPTEGMKSGYGASRSRTTQDSDFTEAELEAMADEHEEDRR